MYVCIVIMLNSVHISVFVSSSAHSIDNITCVYLKQLP